MEHNNPISVFSFYLKHGHHGDGRAEQAMIPVVEEHNVTKRAWAWGNKNTVATHNTHN